MRELRIFIDIFIYLNKFLQITIINNHNGNTCFLNIFRKLLLYQLYSCILRSGVFCPWKVLIILKKMKPLRSMLEYREADKRGVLSRMLFEKSQPRKMSRRSRDTTRSEYNDCNRNSHLSSPKLSASLFYNFELSPRVHKSDICEVHFPFPSCRDTLVA